MVEIEQEELQKLTDDLATARKALEEKETLLTEKETALSQLTEKHNKLKDDYIEVCRHQRPPDDSNGADPFDKFCEQKFKRR